MVNKFINSMKQPTQDNFTLIKFCHLEVVDVTGFNCLRAQLISLGNFHDKTNALTAGNPCIISLGFYLGLFIRHASCG